MDWPLAEAKNKFSEVFERALREGPQRVSRRGKDAVVVLAEADYEGVKRLKRGRKSKPKTFKEFLLSLRGLGPVELERFSGPDRGRGRRVKF